MQSVSVRWSQSLAVLLLGLFLSAAAQAAPIRIVCLGDSNFGAPGVSSSQAYPAQLEGALRAKGMDATVTNAGVNGDTSAGVLSRMDSAVPQGTDVVLVSVGVNDRVERGIAPGVTSANVAQIVARLRARGFEVVLLPTGKAFQGSIAGDPKYHVEGLAGATGPTPGRTNWHLTPQGYAMVVAHTMPQVLAAIARAKGKKKG